MTKREAMREAWFIVSELISCAFDAGYPASEVDEVDEPKVREAMIRIMEKCRARGWLSAKQMKAIHEKDQQDADR